MYVAVRLIVLEALNDIFNLFIRNQDELFKVLVKNSFLTLL